MNRASAMWDNQFPQELAKASKLAFWQQEETGEGDTKCGLTAFQRRKSSRSSWSPRPLPSPCCAPTCCPSTSPAPSTSSCIIVTPSGPYIVNGLTSSGPIDAGTNSITGGPFTATSLFVSGTSSMNSLSASSLTASGPSVFQDLTVTDFRLWHSDYFQLSAGCLSSGFDSQLKHNTNSNRRSECCIRDRCQYNKQWNRD